MSLAPGATLGSYTIVGAIGAGGMGEVYRAHDQRLGRDVAIKVLPDAFANDPERLARFEREAKSLASLSHFNVAQVYEFEGRALVMELLEGETLRSLLAKGPLSARKAVDYALQIARGLSAAHDRGIIHRDLKPENVFVVEDGHLKILDFGLARLVPQSGSGATETVPAEVQTDPAVVMGTVGYMSPEQVRGAALDARSDIFALGAVLYEMLTGRRAFRRETPSETMAAILNEYPPDITTVRADLSPALDRIVQHCLEKKPVERFQTARDVAFALEGMSGSSPAAVGAADARATPARAGERMAWAAATVVLAALAAWPQVSARLGPSPPLPAPSRTLLVLTEGLAFNMQSPPAVRMALSPDATKVVFAARRADVQSPPGLWWQPLDGSEAKMVEGSAGGLAPFWSPDSQQIIFSTPFGANSVLKRVGLDGGPAVAMAGAPGPGTWAPDGTVLVGGWSAGATIRHLTVDGRAEGSVIVGGAVSYNFPFFLPGHQRFLFSGTGDATTASGVFVGSLGSSEKTLVLNDNDALNPQFANGALVFARGDTIFGQRFDPVALRLAGEPVVLATQVESLPRFGAAFSVSASGVLAYIARSVGSATELTWVDRHGRVQSTVSQVGDYSNLELSHDGRRLLVTLPDGQTRTRDVFIVDLARGVRQRFTLDPSDERSAVWSPDDRRVVYTSKGLEFYSRAADSSGAEQLVLKDGVNKDPYDISPDGKLLIYRRLGAGTTSDLWLMPLDGSGPPRPLVATAYSESSGNFSPDGKSVVYVSDESGQGEVYVISVDGGGKAQVSANGGLYPRWRGDGREIVYLRPDKMLMSAAVTGSGTTLKIAAPTSLFVMDTAFGPGAIYDITADGERFIVNTPVPPRLPPAITILTNWPSRLPSR